MRVFLIHGMGRSRVSMLPLAAKLRRAGHDPSLFGYSVVRHPIERIAERFVKHIELVKAEDAKRSRHPHYAIIGHSLGNIVTRFATEQLPKGLAAFAMLAPPNNSPLMARHLQNNPVFKVLTQDAGQRLADQGFYDSLSRPDVRTLIVAGDKAPKKSWLPFKDNASDGVVSVDETRLEGVEHCVMPALHTFIMNHPQVVSELIRFLERED